MTKLELPGSQFGHDMILDILEYSINYLELEDSTVTKLTAATVQLKTMPTVNDCHCHGYNLRGSDRKLPNSTLHDADFYLP